MSEYKFRAWNKEYNVMIQAESFQLYQMWISGIGEVFEIGEWSDYGGGGKTEDDCSDQYILMQYTGLRDKNGKDIYEGDILQVKESLSNFVYNHTNGTITSNSWENNFKHVVKFSPSGLQLVSYFVNQHECEVVGDIYTNPELLEEVRE